MSISINLFDYHLSPERIAQQSIEPRDVARMLVLDRLSGAREHRQIMDLLTFLRSGDVLVFNNTKVFKARLTAQLRGRTYELFLLRCLHGGVETSRWKVLIKRLRRFHLGETFFVGSFPARLVRLYEDESGEVEIEIEASEAEVFAYCEVSGHIPIPAYIADEPKAFEDYQTVYASEVGSVAAPTAGFHFTERLLDQLSAIGVEKTFVTLHVGLGTFQPVKTETLEEHHLHHEWAEVSSGAVEVIKRAKTEGRRVIAVGTTTVRTLEGVAKLKGDLEPYVGDVNLFITPGFDFKIIDGLLTNFHLPKSTLLALVSAFAGRELVLEAYQEAVEKEYRFFSFGDAMLIL